MTSKRPYRDAMPSSIARIRMARAVGTQFDTAVVAAFEAVLAGASEEYRSGRGSAFTFEGQTPGNLSPETPRLLEAVAS